MEDMLDSAKVYSWWITIKAGHKTNHNGNLPTDIDGIYSQRYEMSLSRNGDLTLNALPHSWANKEHPFYLEITYIASRQNIEQYNF